MSAPAECGSVPAVAGGNYLSVSSGREGGPFRTRTRTSENWLEFAFDSGVFLKNSGFGWKSPSFLKNARFGRPKSTLTFAQIQCSKSITSRGPYFRNGTSSCPRKEPKYAPEAPSREEPKCGEKVIIFQ